MILIEIYRHINENLNYIITNLCLFGGLHVNYNIPHLCT